MSKRLGRLLAQARKTKGVRLRDVEEATGISNAYVSQLESGRIGEPSPHKLHALAGYFGLPYEQVLEAAGYLAPTGGDQEGEPTVRFMGDRLTEDEVDAVAAFLRTYRNVRRSSK